MILYYIEYIDLNDCEKHRTDVFDSIDKCSDFITSSKDSLCLNLFVLEKDRNKIISSKTVSLY